MAPGDRGADVCVDMASNRSTRSFLVIPVLAFVGAALMSSQACSSSSGAPTYSLPPGAGEVPAFGTCTMTPSWPSAARTAAPARATLGLTPASVRTRLAATATAVTAGVMRAPDRTRAAMTRAAMRAPRRVRKPVPTPGVAQAAARSTAVARSRGARGGLGHSRAKRSGSSTPNGIRGTGRKSIGGTGRPCRLRRRLHS